MKTEPATATRDLRDTGLKATLPRIRVLRVIQSAERRHWTAEDIYRALLLEGTEVGVATVYRVLGQFEQAGILKRSRFDAERAVYELNDGPHHDHIVCLQCGHIEEFADDQIERRQNDLARDRGFQLVEHTLALFGQCVRPECPHRRR